MSPVPARTSVVLDPAKVISGSYGELYEVTPGTPETFVFLAAIQNFEARITIDRLEVRRSGTRRMGYKRGMISGAGTITGFKVTSVWADRLSEEYLEDGSAQLSYEFESRLNDPEAVGGEVVRFRGVRIWELPVGWAVGDLVTEDIPFTFEDYEVVTPAAGTSTVAR